MEELRFDPTLAGLEGRCKKQVTCFLLLVLRFFCLGAGLVSDVGGAIERAFHVIILRGLAARSGGQLRLRRWLYPDRLRLGHARLDWSRRCFLLFLAPEDNAQSDEDQKD